MKWIPIERFAARYERFLPNHEWKPLFGIGRYAFFVVRRMK